MRLRSCSSWKHGDGKRQAERRRLYAVNGSAYFNRPGPRIVDGLEILLEIIQPELASARGEGTAWQRLA